MFTLFDLKVLAKVYKNFPELYDSKNKYFENEARRKESLQKVAEVMSYICPGTTAEDVERTIDIYRRSYRANRFDKDYQKLGGNMLKDYSLHEEKRMYRAYVYFFEAEGIPGKAPVILEQHEAEKRIHRDHFGRLIDVFNPKDDLFEEMPPQSKEPETDVAPDPLIIKKNEDLAKWKVLHKVTHDALIMKDSTKYPKANQTTDAELFKKVMESHKSVLDGKERELYGTLLESKLIKDFRKAQTIESMYKALKKVFFKVMEEIKNAKDFEERELAKAICSKCDNIEEQNKVVEESLITVYEEGYCVKNCCDCIVPYDQDIPIEDDIIQDISPVKTIAPTNQIPQNKPKKDITKILKKTKKTKKNTPAGTKTPASTTQEPQDQTILMGNILPEVIHQIRLLIEEIMYPEGRIIPAVLTKAQIKSQNKREQRKYKIDPWLLGKIKGILVAHIVLKSEICESKLTQESNMKPLITATETTEMQGTKTDLQEPKADLEPKNHEVDPTKKNILEEHVVLKSETNESNLSQELNMNPLITAPETTEIRGKGTDLQRSKVDLEPKSNEVDLENQSLVSNEDDDSESDGEFIEDIDEFIVEDSFTGDNGAEDEVKGESTELTDIKSEELSEEVAKIEEINRKETFIVEETKRKIEQQSQNLPTSHQTMQVPKWVKGSGKSSTFANLKAQLKPVIKGVLRPIATNPVLMNNCNLFDWPPVPTLQGRVLYQHPITRAQAKKKWRVETIAEGFYGKPASEEFAKKPSTGEFAESELDYSMCSSTYSTTDDSFFLSTDDDSTDEDDWNNPRYNKFKDSLAKMGKNKLGERKVLDVSLEENLTEIVSGCYYKPIDMEELQMKLDSFFKERRYQPFAKYCKETLHQKLTKAAHQVCSTTKLIVLVSASDNDNTLEQPISEAFDYIFEKVYNLTFEENTKIPLRICNICGNYGPCFADKQCPADPKYTEQTFTYDVAGNSSSSDVTTTNQIIDNSSQNGEFEPENQESTTQQLVKWDNESWGTFKEDIGEVLSVVKRFKACEICGKYFACISGCEAKRNNEYRSQNSIEIQTNLDLQETKMISKVDKGEPTMFQPMITWDVETWESFRDDINDALKVVNKFKLCEKCGKFETCTGRCDVTTESRTIQTADFKSVANSTTTEDANVTDLCDKCGTLDMNFCEKSCQNQEGSPTPTNVKDVSIQASPNQFSDSPFNRDNSNETVQPNKLFTTPCNQHCQDQFNNFQNGQSSSQINFADVCQHHQFQYFKMFQSENIFTDQADLKSKTTEEIKLWFRLFVKRFTSIEDPKLVLQVQRDVDNVVYDALLK